MTEQTPKLDVKTLEYVLSLIKRDCEIYDKLVVESFKINDKYKIDTNNGKYGAMTAFGLEIRDLIREQQEA